MTTPTSALGMSHIQTEFGGSNPIAISEYYGVNANVASSGTIRMAQFLGISAAVIRLDAETLTAYGTYNANCASVFHSNGVAQQITTGDLSISGAGSYTWLIVGAAGDYEVRATRTGGTALGSFSSGWANNTWAAMSTSRRVWLYNTSIGLQSLTVSVSIRYTSNGTVISTQTQSFSSEADK